MAPPSTNGPERAKKDWKIYPITDGDTVWAIFLETLVSPDAAVLSSSSTMATIYDCLVGTSIWERPILIK